MVTEELELNKSQKDAVNFNEGPVLVIAGAGTGKTRVITERIRRLIQEEKALPSEILALTFTEKAAAEMLNRLDTVLPLGYEEPWVSTFHAFGERLLRQEALEVGLIPDYQLMTAAESWLFFRQHLFEFDLNYYRPLGNPGKFIAAILTLFSRSQDESVTPEEFMAWAEKENRERMNGETDEKGKWLELAAAYQKYQQLKVEAGRLDFADLLSWTVRIFNSRPAILKKYREQFKYILLDEFQDTNYIQYQIIKFLAPAEQSPNLMVCADDDQSIYKFRGASVANVLEFKTDYPSAKILTLTDNYRSRQPILDAAYRLIQNNNPDRLEEKLKISKKLYSRIEFVPDAGNSAALNLIVAGTAEEEAAGVVEKIAELVAAPESSYTWKDFAILARANSHLERFVTALRAAGVPYQLLGNRGLYDQEEIRVLIAALRILGGKGDDVAYYQLLNSPGLVVSPALVSDLLTQSYRRRLPLEQVLAEYVLGDKAEQGLVALVNLITKLRGEVSRKPVTRLFYEFISTSKIMAPLLTEETLENQLKIQNINIFFTKIRQFEAESRNPTLFDFLDFLDLCLDAGENPAQAEVEDIDTVSLLTVHAAKGLEYRVVFLVSLTSDRFPTRERNDPIPLPAALVKETLPEGDAHLEEERRLFYVAVTRAKERLYLSLAKTYGGVREKKPSGFISELGLTVALPEKSTKKNGESISFLNQSQSFPPELISSRGQTIPELKSVSYSQLETFSQCPLKYKYRYILGLSGEPSHVLAFGQTIHRTLRDFHRPEILNQEKGGLPSLLEIYGRQFLGEGYESQEHRERRFLQGREILENYFKKHQDLLTVPVFLEQRFRIRLGDIALVGSIDRVDRRTDGTYEIIDYKTGEGREQKEVDRDAQLSIYALAAAEDLKITADRLSLYFIESNKKLTTSRSTESLLEKKEELLETVNDIRSSAFPAKVSLLCRYCEFRPLCPEYKLSLNL
ncbi:MAG: ATP-dependent DNA helicase [Patescibacteria group bacterium]